MSAYEKEKRLLNTNKKKNNEQQHSLFMYSWFKINPVQN